MKKMSHARTIRIQKLQNKNRMVGKTFNPGGHTSESLNGREKMEVERIKKLSEAEFLELGDNYQKITDYKERENVSYSNSFEQNVFHRNFQKKYLTLKKQNNV
tara:strand:- start:28808 stop:29116 length:309 start_codon:yes stop_codon:yes gene_type:complete